MSPRHADTGQHLPRHEAAWIVGRYWGERKAERRHSQPRTVVWAPDRYVPIGVIEGAA